MKKKSSLLSLKIEETLLRFRVCPGDSGSSIVNGGGVVSFSSRTSSNREGNVQCIERAYAFSVILFHTIVSVSPSIGCKDVSTRFPSWLQFSAMADIRSGFEM